MWLQELRVRKVHIRWFGARQHLCQWTVTWDYRLPRRETRRSRYIREGKCNRSLVINQVELNCYNLWLKPCSRTLPLTSQANLLLLNARRTWTTQPLGDMICLCTCKTNFRLFWSCKYILHVSVKLGGGLKAPLSLWDSKLWVVATA